MTVRSTRGWTGLWAFALAACTSGPSAPSAPAPAAPFVAPPAALQASAPAPVASGAPPASSSEEPKGSPLFPGHARLRIGQEELRARFDPFPRALTPIVSMGEQTVAHQIPMTMAFFETRASIVEVLEFYAQRFDRRGWSWTGLEENSKIIDHPAISATDPEDGSQMSVLVVSNGKDAPRTVILAIADVRPEARVPDEGELPRYPGTSPIALRTTEFGANSFTHTFVTPDSVAEVVGFYSTRMRDLGWEERSGPPEPGEPTLLTFAKGGRVWRVRVSAQKEATLVLAVSAAHEEDRP